MKLFHESNIEIDEVDLAKCMPNKDFGCGFYTTLLEEQAWRMAQRRAKIDGGSPVAVSYTHLHTYRLEMNGINMRETE